MPQNVVLYICKVKKDKKLILQNKKVYQKLINLNEKSSC